jgi:hypothetical protein
LCSGERQHRIGAKEALRLRSFDLQSKSIEDLWALHEEVKGILVAKIEAQKLKLEKRIEQLQGNAKRPYPKVTPKFQIPNYPIRRGLVAVSSRIGSANSLLRVKRSTTF